MRIDNIKIKNFKGFEDKSFTLNQFFTVFIGDNGKGKTSVLDALAISASDFLLGIDAAQKEAKPIHKSQIRIRTIDGDPKPQLPVQIRAAGWVGEKQLSWVNEIIGVNGSSITNTGTREIEEVAHSLLERSRTAGGVTFPVLAYHGTGRLWAEHKKVDYRKQEESVQMAYNNCLSPKSSSKEFLSWYKTYEDEVSKFGQANDKEMLEAFKEAIIGMIPDGRWEDMAFSFKDDDLIGIFSSGEAKEKLLFQQLSDGYRNVIGMAADIAYRCIKLNPHLGKDVIKKTPGIVLIDEIDLHLHPNWQKRIVADLKKTFPSLQFMATTQSPFIVQSLTNDELINLDPGLGLDEDPNRYSIEEVASQEMGVENVERSETFMEMQTAAMEFFDLIKAKAEPGAIEKAKIKLDELSIKYNNDPAYVALLESELPKVNQ